jgi:acetyl/propionyl-CoA carboxylase alpha subunit
VQLAGDRHGGLVQLGERECSIQRRHQKLIEVAPSPSLSDALRQRIVDAALALGRAAQLDNLCTMEFLVDASAQEGDHAFFFIEANPRLQVEHTVTEMVLDLDLVQAQLALAAGATLADWAGHLRDGRRRAARRCSCASTPRRSTLPASRRPTGACCSVSSRRWGPACGWTAACAPATP